MAPLGLRLCAAKPELQARARPLGRAQAAVSGLSCAKPRVSGRKGPRQARRCAADSNQVRERLVVQAHRRRERARPGASRRAGAVGPPGLHNAALRDHLPTLQGKDAAHGREACCVTPIM